MNLKQGHELKEFNRLYKELEDIYHEIALKAGISDSAFAILYTLMEFGDGCLQKDIAEYYSTSKQTINSSIKKLAAKGLILLQKGKGRNMHVYLTAQGRQFTEEKIAPVLALENSIFTEMSPEESREFLRLTKKYILLYKEKVSKLYDTLQNN